ncbi:MAG TPA: response regulator [Geobacteraceae bacterium]|nr:response regulator [Geobacteraceae bacterium]
MSDRKRIGEIFIERGLITEKTLERALERAKRQKKRIGLTLEEIEVITRDELAKALAEQYDCKVVSNFARFQFPRELLDMIPVDVALQNLLFPLKEDKGRLAMAMADPTNTSAVQSIAASRDLRIIPFIATRQDIISAINRHYLGKSPEQHLEKTVMLVEDDHLISDMLQDILAMEGYRVIVAADGMEGYKAMLAEAPHVIIAEQGMPRLDAHGLLDLLKSLPDTRDIPIILLTGYMDADEEARIFQKGFFDFLTKPVKGATLITRVRRAFQHLELQGLDLGV